MRVPVARRKFGGGRRRSMLGTTTAVAALATLVVASSGSAADSNRMAALGKAAGVKAGPKVALPTGKTIAVMRFSATSDADKRFYATFQQLGKRLGFKVIGCDPNFDPQKTRECMSGFAAQKPDAIVSFLHDPATLGGGLKDAYDQGIPVIVAGAEVTPSPYVTQYVLDETIHQRMLDKWFFAKMKAKVGKGKVAKYAAMGAPGASLASRLNETQRKADDRKDPGVTEVITHDLDLTNIVQDTIKTTTQALQQYSDLAGLFTVCDFCSPLIAQQVAAERRGKDRPIIAATYVTKQSLAELRRGRIDGLLEYPWEANVYVVADRLVENWARGTSLKKGAKTALQPSPGVDFRQGYMLTKENAGKSGPIPLLSQDFRAYYNAKWQQEFRGN